MHSDFISATHSETKPAAFRSEAGHRRVVRLSHVLMIVLSFAGVKRAWWDINVPARLVGLIQACSLSVTDVRTELLATGRAASLVRQRAAWPLRLLRHASELALPERVPPGSPAHLVQLPQAAEPEEPAHGFVLLFDRDITVRRDKRLSTRLRHDAAIEDVDYRSARGLDRALFQKLIQGKWIDAHDNLVLSGPTGIGKSWLACALGHKAYRDDSSVLYQRTPKLFTELALARAEGRHGRMIRTLGTVNLLILDDFGLAPLDAGARHDLLEIVEDRYGRRATIITSQIPPAHWHELIGDPTYADAILDRLLHNAHRIELTGESLRKTRKQTPKTA